jgi:hypothetical protein
VIDDMQAQRLLYVAAQLAARVRDDEPESVARWLCGELDGLDRWRLLFVLAAMVPVEESPDALVRWFFDRQRWQSALRVVRGEAS